MTIVSTAARAAKPAVAPSAATTSLRQLDEMVARLREAAPGFARLSISERIALAQSMQAGYLRIARRSVETACAVKGISADSPVAGEEWATGPWSVVRHLRLIIESLRSIERTGTTAVGSVGRNADGRLTVRVFPANRIDGVLFSGQTVDVHMLPGVTEESLEATRASFYKGGMHEGNTVLVLGAGNIASIPAMDVVTKLFNEGSVCLLKMNPVNAYIGPFIEEAFAKAIARGLLAVAYGGVEEGAYLAQHRGVDEIHLTGSAGTYDSIVWGPPGPERDARKARNQPLLTKRVTAELGNVSPVLVVPGPYSDKELAFRAENIAGAVTCNASFLCNSAKMLITPKAWGQRRALLGALERILGDVPPRKAYYPGADQRWQRLAGARDQVRTMGPRPRGNYPGPFSPGWMPATRVKRRSPPSPSAPFSRRRRSAATIRWSSSTGRWTLPTIVYGEPCRPTLSCIPRSSRIPPSPRRWSGPSAGSGTAR